MKLSTTFNKILRETTVTARDAQGNFLCCETQSGTGARVVSRLEQQVRVQAERLERTSVVLSSTSTLERRLLTARLA